MSKIFRQDPTTKFSKTQKESQKNSHSQPPARNISNLPEKRKLRWRLNLVIQYDNDQLGDEIYAYQLIAEGPLIMWKKHATYQFFKE